MFIGIDLGGTKITGAVFDRAGTVLRKQSALLDGLAGKEVGALVRMTIIRLIASQGAGEEHVAAVGVCVPGIVNSKTGRVWAPNIAGWEDYPLQQELEAAFRPLRIDIASDRTCHILGESWKGAAQGCRDALFMAVGTGIGLGILAGGKILHGHGDIAGATGWMTLKTSYRDEYKIYGCFESHASGNGIARQVRQLLEKNRYADSSLYKQTPASVTMQHIFHAYENRDPLATQVINKAIMMWGMASANLVSLFNPEKILWGGGVFGPAACLIDRIYEEACRWAQPIAIKQVRFEVSQLGGDAGLYGAGRLGSMK